MQWIFREIDTKKKSRLWFAPPCVFGPSWLVFQLKQTHEMNLEMVKQCIQCWNQQDKQMYLQNWMGPMRKHDPDQKYIELERSIGRWNYSENQ